MYYVMESVSVVAVYGTVGELWDIWDGVDIALV